MEEVVEEEKTPVGTPRKTRSLFDMFGAVEAPDDTFADAMDDDGSASLTVAADAMDDDGSASLTVATEGTPSGSGLADHIEAEDLPNDSRPAYQPPVEAEEKEAYWHRDSFMVPTGTNWAKDAMETVTSQHKVCLQNLSASLSPVLTAQP
jgi:hypothetical protein